MEKGQDEEQQRGGSQNEKRALMQERLDTHYGTGDVGVDRYKEMVLK